MALPRPIVEPPPTATQQSASSRLAVSRAARAVSIGHVHHRFGVDARGGAAQTPRRLVGVLALLRRRQDQRAPRAETRHFFWQAIERADAEDHANRRLVVDEGVHGAEPLLAHLRGVKLIWKLIARGETV